MNIEVQLLEEPMPDYETRKAMEDVYHRKGTKLNNLDQLFSSDWEKLSKNQKQGIIDAIDEIDAGKGIPESVVMRKFRKNICMPKQIIWSPLAENDFGNILEYPSTRSI